MAVIKSYVGLPSEDVSGTEFKFGTLVKPGHRGIWEDPLRTGKYAINPRCYQAEIVPTFILTLSWADAVSRAHQLDAELKPIDAKSREGFIFHIDLQVQIHVPDTKAPRVISIVGTMQNLVSEVLQAAVGNHFRDKLQSLPAVKFIETRQEVQNEAFEHIKSQLTQYEVETKGVYIQDVVLPSQLVEVLTQREIANQKIETLKKQQQAENERIAMEKTKGQADMQSQLATSEVQISIKENNAGRPQGRGRRRGRVHPADRHRPRRRGPGRGPGPGRGLPRPGGRPRGRADRPGQRGHRPLGQEPAVRPRDPGGRRQRQRRHRRPGRHPDAALQPGGVDRPRRERNSRSTRRRPRAR